MKYFFSTLVTLISILVLSSPAWARGEGGDRGWQAVAGVFANQTSNNNGTTTTTTTETDFHGDLGYDFGTLYIGGTYFNTSTSTAAASTTSTFLTWEGVSVGLVSHNFRLVGTYIASAFGSGGLSNGTGFGGNIAYCFYVSPKVFIAPLVDYYSVTFTSPGPKNTTITQLAPFLSVGIDF